jgi:acyl carrier protein
MSDEIAEKVQRIVARSLRRPVAEVHPESSFATDLMADSLELVELVMAIEREFDVKIPDAEAEKLRTVQDAISHIRSALS